MQQRFVVTRTNSASNDRPRFTGQPLAASPVDDASAADAADADDPPARAEVFLGADAGALDEWESARGLIRRAKPKPDDDQGLPTLVGIRCHMRLGGLLKSYHRKVA
jgi:hypothetical protein